MEMFRNSVGREFRVDGVDEDGEVSVTIGDMRIDNAVALAGTYVPRAVIEAMARALGLQLVDKEEIDALRQEADKQRRIADDMTATGIRIAELRDARIAELQAEIANLKACWENANEHCIKHLEDNQTLRAELAVARNAIHVLCQALADTVATGTEAAPPQRAYYPAILEGQVGLDTADVLLQPLTLTRLVKEAHTNAVAKGFHEGNTRGSEAAAWTANAVAKGFHANNSSTPNDIAARLMLIVSELAEGLEEVRDGHLRMYEAVDRKPEGLVVELADAVIRIADLCGLLGLDLEAAVRIKMEFNKTRPMRHGKQL